MLLFYIERNVLDTSPDNIGRFRFFPGILHIYNMITASPWVRNIPKDYHIKITQKLVGIFYKLGDYIISDTM